MVYSESGFPDSIQFSEYDDPCEDLTEEECEELTSAVDITFAMALLDCSEDDMKEVLNYLVDLLSGELSEIEHICHNGNRIRVVHDEENSIMIMTDPPLDEIEPDEEDEEEEW